MVKAEDIKKIISVIARPLLGPWQSRKLLSSRLPVSLDCFAQLAMTNRGWWGACDIVFVGGTFEAVPHVVPSWARQWLQHQEPWTSLLVTASKQAYMIHYQLQPEALVFLNQARNLPIRRLYFWPLEAAQQLLKNHRLKKHRPTPWSVFWLPAPPLFQEPSDGPSGTISMMAYHNERPLFCRMLPASAVLDEEVVATRQYLKRFGYEQSDQLRVFAPDVPPTIRRPAAPLAAPKELARNRWLARIPLATQTSFAALIVFGSGWQLMDLYQRPQQAPVALSSPTKQTAPHLVAPTTQTLAPPPYVSAIVCDDNGWAVWINEKKWTNTDMPQEPYTIKAVTPSQVTLVANGQDVILEVR